MDWIRNHGKPQNYEVCTKFLPHQGGQRWL